MSLEFAKTAPGVRVASWTHPRSGRVHSIAVIESCDAWNTFIDGEWIARDLPSFEEAVAAAETELTPKTSPKMIRVAGVLLLALIVGASAVVASKFIPAISTPEIAKIAEIEEVVAVTEGEEAGASARKYHAKEEKVAPDKPVRDLGVSQQPLPVRRERPTLQPSARHF